MMKEEKGITLVALVITIIVMLILVGVSVNIAINGGLISQTKSAAQQTNGAVANETNISDQATYNNGGTIITGINNIINSIQ